jgi:hypothetical protein
MDGRLADDAAPTSRSHRERIGYSACNRQTTGGNATTRPYAADDFTAIRARLEELRRERDQIQTAQNGRSPIGPKPYHRATTTTSDIDDQGARLVPHPFSKLVR